MVIMLSEIAYCAKTNLNDKTKREAKNPFFQNNLVFIILRQLSQNKNTSFF
jgi:hypothetical protein